MSDVVFKTKVDDFLARRVKDLIWRGSFRDEDAFLKVAIVEMVRICETRDLEERIRQTSQKIGTKYSMSISDAVLSARAEEDEEL